MTEKQKYWIASPMGEYAQVEGSGERDRWTKVLGWTEVAEPAVGAQVHIQHPDGLRGRIPLEALEGGWSGLGWSAGPPPEPVDLTKDRRLVDQPPAPVPPTEPVEPAKSQTPAATGGTKIKE